MAAHSTHSQLLVVRFPLPPRLPRRGLFTTPGKESPEVGAVDSPAKNLSFSVLLYSYHTQDH